MHQVTVRYVAATPTHQRVLMPSPTEIAALKALPVELQSSLQRLHHCAKTGKPPGHRFSMEEDISLILQRVRDEKPFKECVIGERKPESMSNRWKHHLNRLEGLSELNGVAPRHTKQRQQ